MKIPFNKPFLTGRETEYITRAVESGKISGDGMFTKKCHELLQSRYGFKKVLLTTSCTDALEMAALLIDTMPGDEIIIPSFTFVSTANAFVLRGATIIFADSQSTFPNIDIEKIEALITPKTKAIVPVHYAGIANDMDKIMDLAEKYGLYVIEDAAQAIASFYKGRPLGSIGHLAAFSFHETKNIIAGEGGMLVINDERFIKRAEIIREKGTNRSALFRGEIDKYEWMDLGSSFLPSEITAAFLFAQLENLDDIQIRREELWKMYYEKLIPLERAGKIRLPVIPSFASNNAHLFYILCKDAAERSALIDFLKEKEILAVFHYLSLHSSHYFVKKHDGRDLPFSDYYSNCLLRLPLFYELSKEGLQLIINLIFEFYGVVRA
jgi:dTDP-4-amino-4,6-dideoxygalactose transaminase